MYNVYSGRIFVSIVMGNGPERCRRQVAVLPSILEIYDGKFAAASTANLPRQVYFLAAAQSSLIALKHQKLADLSVINYYI